MKRNIQNIVFLSLLAIIIAFFSLSYVFVEAKSFSEDENRVLQTAPRFTFEKLLDGTYTRQLHDYCSDQINLRGAMVSFKAILELATGKCESGGVLYGKDGYLIETHNYTEDNLSYLRKNLLKIDKLANKLTDGGVKVNESIIPRKVDVLTQYLPPYYSTQRNELALALVDRDELFLVRALTDAQRGGAEVFYKTDHHWTAEGAYVAYKALGVHLGYTPHPISHFELTSLTDTFHGTTYSSSGFFFVPTESILCPTVSESRYTTTVADIGTSFGGILDRSYLEKKDKYSTFLSGNNAEVIIRDNVNTDKETLLIVKDSFSHSLVPYLIEHYDIVLIDPRYYTGSIEEYVAENGIENVLFLFGLDTLASANLIIR